MLQLIESDLEEDLQVLNDIDKATLLSVNNQLKWNIRTIMVKAVTGFLSNTGCRP